MSCSRISYLRTPVFLIQESLIYPNLTELYIKKVSSLRDNLNNINFKNEASQILRSLVDEIRLHPIEKKLQIELVGDLASLIGFGTQYDSDINKRGLDNDPGCTKWLVAGARSLLFRTLVSAFLTILP